MKRRFLSGLTGRILIIFISTVMAMAVIFGLASVFMAYDPDGHLIRQWLYDSRWALFAWRLMVYAGIAAFWLIKVRPAMLKRWPEVRAGLPRTELLCVLFILATECVAWTGVA